MDGYPKKQKSLWNHVSMIPQGDGASIHNGPGKTTKAPT